MNLRKLKYIVLAGALGLSGCEKYLDQEPDMRAEINTVDKVKRLVASAYPAANYLAMAELYSDNVEDKGVGGSDDPISSLYYWQDINDNGTGTPTSYWNACYEAIAAANHALAAIEKNDFGDEVLPYKGEALVARAYAHFMLVNFFAKPYDKAGGAANSSPGIPYVTEPETVVLKNYDRGTVASVYESIRKDLEEGIPLLSGGIWTVPKYHFTPAAAHAFASRFYLFTGEWQKVVDHASSIFGSSGFVGKLTPYNSLFKANTYNWVHVNFAKADQTYNLLINETYSIYQRFSTVRYAMGVNVFMNLYNANTAVGAPLYNFGLSYGTPHYTAYLWNEFFYVTDATANTGYPMLMVPVLITDEALLNRAEAYIELGNNAMAIADLNLFASNRVNNYNATTHAVTAQKSKEFFNVSDDKTALIETTLQFKQVGFLDMGLRWFDIIRKGITVKHNILSETGEETFMELKPDDHRRQFQIPQEAVLSNVPLNPR